MMSHELLVAASPEIRAKAWLESQVSAVIERSGFKVTMLGRCDTLKRVLDDASLEYSVIHPEGKPSRGELRTLLARMDYVLLFWNGLDHTKLLFEARLMGKKMKVVAFETTSVVNRDKGDEFDVYIGRGTPWGNPFPVGVQEGQYSREEAIELYRMEFERRLHSEPNFAKALLGLRGYRLACFCKPLACHGDIIANHLNSLPPASDATDS